jgi:hypothetical protein
MKNIKKWDKTIIGITIILSILPMGFIKLANKGVKNESIVIKVGSETVKRIKLENSTTSKLYDFKFGSNTGYIEVKNGEVRMLEMDKKTCPEGICSKTGWIKERHQSIVCLPNKIVVTFEGQQNGDIDSVVY